MRQHRIAPPLLLAAFVALALAFSVTIPLGEAPDEVSHWSYVQYLSTHWQLPPPSGAVSGESHQPPLYYLISAIATAWIPREDFQVIANPDFALGDPQASNLLLHTRREEFPYRGEPLAWHLVRLLSVAMGAVTVWAVWQLATVFFPGDGWIALGAASFTAFLPGFISLSAVVNNDNFVVMLSSLTILQVVRTSRRPLRRADAAVLGVLLGLAALAKLSGLVVWLFVAAVLSFRAVRSREWRSDALRAALCFGVAAVMVSPWVIYNLQKYGDPLGWALVLSVTPLRHTPLTVNDWATLARGLYTSFWGRFGGGLIIHLPNAAYAMFGGSIVLSLIGWARYARQRPQSATARALVALFALFWLLMLAAFVRWTLVVLGTDQARQLFPGLPLLAVFLVAGIARLAPVHKEIVLALWSAAFFAAALGSLFYLDSNYALSQQSLAALPPLDHPSARADFGQTIRVADFRIDKTRAAPGDTIMTEIYWQALSNPTEDYWLLLQVADKNGAVANKDGVPSAGRLTTDWWQSGQVFASHHALVIPQDIAPGNYTLRLGLHPFGKWDWLPVRGGEMLDLNSLVIAARP
ncbi:MAG: hypothetical protein KGJ80_01110 [Chloroflexota bacterium]|nr:hypothetical protein [Chloroflexota bacterium]